MTASRRFTALGTYVHVATASAPDRDDTGLDDAVRVVRQVLDEVDLACSRFRRDSDLSRANGRGGSWTPVSPTLVAAVRTALAVAEDTDGLVDPLLGRTMVSLGYDRTLRQLRDTGVRRPLAVHSPGAWRELGVTDEAVRVPDGTALDLGAVGKAWAADVAAAEVAALVGVDVVVSVGGDVALAGGTPWPVAVAEHPDSPAEETVVLSSGGLATSSTQVRRWTSAGTRRHHLVDPRTGAPTAGPWRTVTAVGRSASAANAASTAAVVLGEDAVAWLTARGVAARLVREDGTVARTTGWPEQQPDPWQESA